MKFTCLKCNKEMVNTKAGNTEDGLTNTSFSCPECGSSFGLVTNAMETKAIRELVLHTEACGTPEKATTNILWDKDAQARLSNIPEMVRSMAQKGIEKYAAERGLNTITTEVMDKVKELYGM
ncbi:MAG: PCP reductase family protein [Nitrospirota bacterium]